MSRLNAAGLCGIGCVAVAGLAIAASKANADDVRFKIRPAVQTTAAGSTAAQVRLVHGHGGGGHYGGFGHYGGYGGYGGFGGYYGGLNYGSYYWPRSYYYQPYYRSMYGGWGTPYSYTWGGTGGYGYGYGYPMYYGAGCGMSGYGFY